jgi:hypothetical protein
MDPFGLCAQEYRSPGWLRALVPGQGAFDNGVTSLQAGRYADAALFFGQMLGEQLLAVATLGEGSALLQGTEAATAGFPSLVPKNEIGTTTEDVVNLFHQGDLSNGVSATRSLSTSPVSDLMHDDPSGQLYQFQVPRSTLNDWLEQGLARELNDMHYPSGIVRPEIRISPPASGLMNRYLVSPGG